MLNGLVSAAKGFPRRVVAVALALTLLGTGVAYTLRGGGNGEILQQWQTQTKGGAAAGSGRTVAHMTSSGSLSLSGTLVSDRATDIGWSVVAGVNTACNTTCTHACVFGQRLGTGTGVVACTDATADQCLCAGSN